MMPTSAQRREQRGPRADDDRHRPVADPPPLVGPLALPETGMEDGDLLGGGRPQAVEEWRGQRDLRHQHERAASEAPRSQHGRHVDRRLSSRRDAIEQERPRAPGLDGPDDGCRGPGLVGAHDGAGRSGRHVSVSIGVGQAVDGGRLERDEPAARQAGHRPGPEAGRQLRSRQRRSRVGDERCQGRQLPWPEAPALGGTAVQHRRAPGIGDANEAHVAPVDRRWTQLPGELDAARGRERPQASHGGRAVTRTRQARDRDAARPGLEDPAEQLRVRTCRGLVACLSQRARHVVEALERAGWQGRPDDHGRRRQVVLGDDPGQGQLERRQERALRADALRDRLEVDGGAFDRGRRSEHDAQGLPSPEVDDDRLAWLEPGQPVRHRVGVGPATRGADRVDGDLDLWRLEHGRRQSRTRRLGCRARSASRIASMAAAVRSTSPVSLTTTWS